MLRQVFISVIFNPRFLIENQIDESILRAAHCAIIRQQKDITDVFLFVLCGQLNVDEARIAIAKYGFPDVSVVVLETLDENNEEIAEYFLKENIELEIFRWVQKYHPGAITNLFYEEYESVDMWWAGIEAVEDSASLTMRYSHTLPSTHTSKASTWLAILADIFEHEEGCWTVDLQFTLNAAALCEWLHGFEAASGNNYNNFEADLICSELEIEDLYLGFLAGQYFPNVHLKILNDADAEDLRGMRENVLKQIVERKRSGIRDNLSGFFGGDTALFWALHTSIWPKFDEPSAESCNALVNPSCLEDVGEIFWAWQFITNGWTDSADG